MRISRRIDGFLPDRLDRPGAGQDVRAKVLADGELHTRWRRPRAEATAGERDGDEQRGNEPSQRSAAAPLIGRRARNSAHAADKLDPRRTMA